MSLSAGRLRERVTFKTPGSTPDGSGGWTGDPSNYATNPTVWAEVLPTGGREAVIAGMQAGIQAWKVTVRYRSDVESGHLISWRDKTLNIRSAADPDGMRDSLVIFADSGVLV